MPAAAGAGAGAGARAGGGAEGARPRGSWAEAAEPADRVVTGWGTALTAGASRSAVALREDADRAGLLLASGFRRPVGQVRPAGRDRAGKKEAMRAFVGRTGLGPVLTCGSSTG
ncbi:hypothetical protein ABT269_11180 [Streptomyces viridosporus]|uniref:hypothetical protein n=1 Tax=Streptomyces viridosporus TaxID=67581 RepID=UPI00331D090A